MSRGDDRERGSAVAEFAMVAALLSVLFLGVLQVAFTLHVRNTLISCAAEGARYGARLGSSPAEGADRTRELIAASLADSYASGVSAGTGVAGGVEVVVVRVHAPVPVLGIYGVGADFDLVGRAFQEGQ
ncbi:TadE family protein [Janibacter sp. G1551]|uniref:TadE family protein n=1 Tax=Janibacter sp. G1551 TaxID=3420440 RepID=UPI003D020915